MANVKKNHFWKKMFWSKKQNMDQGILESFFNNIFITNKSEKKKTLSLINHWQINSLLFYTDVHNLENILKFGIRPVRDLELKSEETYYVWSFDQDEETVSLEFDLSSRGNFWKWTNDLELEPKNIATIGINPKRLSELTQKDWLLDWAKNSVIISEDIYVETIDWILVQNIYVYKKIRNYVYKHNIDLDIYYGNDGIVKTHRKISED